MVLNNRWIRRRARRLVKAHPYVSRREAIMSAIEDYHAAYPHGGHPIH